MSSRFRPTRPEDAGEISKFMQQVFGMPADSPGLNVLQMDWKYWREHPEWEGSRGYVMERDGHIIAHGSVVPLTCIWGDRRLKMVDLIDWAGSPAHPGAGITLLKRVSQLVEGVFIAGGTEAAQRVFVSLGFRESAAAAKYALPVRPLRRFVRDSEPLFKRAARLARNTHWTIAGLPATPAGWSARQLSPEEVGGTSFPKPHPRAEPAIFERRAAGIALLLECPITPSEFYLVEKDGQARGYFVLNLVQNQCRVGEAWVEPGGPEDWRALYVLAARQGRKHSQITEVVTAVTNDPAANQGLQQSGFRSRGWIPLRLLIPGGAYPAAVRYQLVDNDSAYMNHGSEVHWT